MGKNTSQAASVEFDRQRRSNYARSRKESVIEVDKLRDIDLITTHFEDSEHIKKSYISEVNTSTGVVTINLEAPEYLYDEILKETMGISVRSKADLLMLFQDYNEAKCEYDQIKSALQMVRTTGYGVACPTLKDMKLETPEKRGCGWVAATAQYGRWRH